MRPVKIFTVLLSMTIVSVFAVENRNAGRISDFLDSEGIEYQIIRDTAWKKLFNSLDSALSKAMWEDDVFDDHRHTVLTWMTAVKMAWQVSGLENASGVGRSTSVIDNSGLFHRRYFLALDTALPGLLNEFFPRNELKTAGFLAEVPAGKAIHLVLDIHPVSLLDSLEKCGNFGNKILSMLPVGVPVRELLTGVDGVWSLTIIEDRENQDNIFIRISLPDPENKLFSMGAVIFNAQEEAKKGTVSVDDNLFAVKENGRLTVFSGHRAAQAFAAVGKLQLTPEERSMLLHRIPEKACVIEYSNITEVEAGSHEVFGFNIPDFFPEGKALMTISREKTGFLATGNSNRVFLEEDFSNGLFLYELLTTDPSAVEADEEEGEAEDEAGEEDEEEDEEETVTVREVRPRKWNKGDAGDEPVKESAAVVEEREECRCQELFNLYFQQFPKGGDAGAFRVKEGKLVKVVPGEKFDLVSFGVIQSDRPVPQLIAFPHKADFCLTYAGGKMEKLELENPRRLRRIIGYLHTIHRYNEELFRQLIDLAAGFEVK